MSIVMRFAPSPTGGLHIGTARTALFNWLAARSMGGKLILRIEDTDLKRSSKSYEQSIIENLQWLSISWDAFYRQSERLDLYAGYAKKLLEKGTAYRCFCSPDRLKKLKKAQYAAGQDSKYDNRCRNLSEKEIDEKLQKGLGFAIRFKVVPDREITFNDLIRGRISLRSSLMGDFVILKSDRTPSYNFGAVVDDAQMEISHIIRGEDHISNTARQLILFKEMGYKPPYFAHLPMILGPDQTKLSKRHGATTISQFREMGYLAAGLGNYLCTLSWTPPGQDELFTLDEAAGRFRLSDVSKSPAIFDQQKHDWINGNHIRRLDEQQLVSLAVPFLIKEGIIDKKDLDCGRRMDKITMAVEAHKNKIKVLSELPDLLGGLFCQEIEDYSEESMEILAQNAAGKVAHVLLSELKKRAHKSELSPQEAKQIIQDMQNRLKSDRIKGKLLYMPIRASITGKTHGPELPKIISILGPQACIKRIKQTREHVKKNGIDW